MLKSGSAAVLDVRSARDYEWGKIKGALHAPVVVSRGSSLNPVTEPNPGFVAAVAARVRDRAAPVVLYGPGRADDRADSVYVSKEMFVSLVPIRKGDKEVGGAGGARRGDGGGFYVAIANPLLLLIHSTTLIKHKSPSPHTHAHVCTPSPRPPKPLQDVVQSAAAALRDAGYTAITELEGGFRAWDLTYRPDGRRRAKGSWAKGTEQEMWTASN